MTKTTPVELVYGRRLKGFYELFDPIHVSEVAVFDPNQYKNTLRGKLANIYNKVKLAFQKAKIQQPRTYNLRHKPLIFEVGELVLKKNFPKSNKLNNINQKLCPKYTGIFKVLEKRGRDQYRIESLNGKDEGFHSGANLKPVRMPFM